MTTRFVDGLGSCVWQHSCDTLEFASSKCLE